MMMTQIVLSAVNLLRRYSKFCFLVMEMLSSGQIVVTKLYAQYAEKFDKLA